ncbi:hypothetical protein MLD38_015687 [Melastoma candidum]|uniref:Uncharacterized protein n=1 Tax=Melastoma candidum TaxID=119954 RepID=A0ACB9RG80_9MYRT|nr:hypothetical protein MLD38_015687 [Melastoma candidum]
MLAKFGKSPEYAWKPCVLYIGSRLMMKNVERTVHINGRGFSKFDAMRGSDIAEFLNEGDPCGGLKKSLEEHDPKAPEESQNILGSCSASPPTKRIPYSVQII